MKSILNCVFACVLMNVFLFNTIMSVENNNKNNQPRKILGIEVQKLKIKQKPFLQGLAVGVASCAAAYKTNDVQVGGVVGSAGVFGLQVCSEEEEKKSRGSARIFGAIVGAVVTYVAIAILKK